MALTDNLVAYYKLDGNSNDSVGSNNGTASNITYVAGKISNAGSFNGSSSKITIPNNIINSSGAFTISLWINYNTQNNMFIFKGYWSFFARAFATGNYLEVGFSENGSAIYSKITTANDTLPQNTWMHVVITSAPYSQIVYINGVSCGTLAVNVSNNSTQTGFGANINGNSEHLKGMLDEIGIWSRALSPTEVTQLYNSGAGLSYPFSTPNTSAFFNLF